MHDTHFNGKGQIFIKNLSQNQRFYGETGLFRLTYSIIIDIKRNKDEADIDEFDDYIQNEDETSDENQTENQ